MFRTIGWSDEGVVLLDQRLLPERELYLPLRTPEEVAAAIRDMAIRGAPAIGVAAAMGIALGFRSAAAGDPVEQFERLAKLFAATRPTAVNLFWAIAKMRLLFEARRGGRGPRVVGGPRRRRPGVPAGGVEGEPAGGGLRGAAG